VRSHFGDHIALYFGFLNFYFQSLFSLAVVGTAFWAAGAPFHPLYSLLLVVWSCVFVEIWRMKERKIAVRWGTVGVSHVDARRKEFKPRTTRKDPVTGEDEEVFEWWRRELRIALSIPVIIFFVALLGAVLTTMFVIEVFATQLYHGPGKGAVHFIPTAILATCVPQVMAAWQATAAALTSWENHYSQRTHSSSMTLKMFGLQAIVTYGALTLSAFVYLPFGQDIMNAIVNRGYFADSVALAKKQNGGKLHFEMNPDRMSKQLFAVLTTSQVINAFTEIGVPFIMRKIAEFREDKETKKGEEQQMANSPNGQFLQRVRDELDLPNYDTFGDYAELASQLGFLCLWSVIWPLAPVMAFINNFFELRSDALKMTINARRPVPQRAESIGPWLEVLVSNTSEQMKHCH
jgi:anoctamin-10